MTRFWAGRAVTRCSEGRGRTPFRAEPARIHFMARPGTTRGRGAMTMTACVTAAAVSDDEIVLPVAEPTEPVAEVSVSHEEMQAEMPDVFKDFSF